MAKSGLGTGIALSLICFSANFVHADVRPGGLGTRVNGSVFGSCTAGLCRIHGGTHARNNLFYRLSSLDSRGQIKGVELNTAGKKNIFVGVTNQAGTFLDKPFTLQGNANVIMLSPGGIWLGDGARFQNFSNLVLSTSSGIRLGNHAFDVFSSTEKDLLSFNESPSFVYRGPNAEDNLVAGLIAYPGSRPIELNNKFLSVDQNLIISAIAGSLTAEPSDSLTLQAGSSVRLSGHKIILNNTTIDSLTSRSAGEIDIRALATSQREQGSVTMLNSAALGQQISLQAGNLSIKDSHFFAPKGWIQLSSTNPDNNNNINLTSSTFDVEPHTLDQLRLPLQFSYEPSQLQTLVPTPHIGILSSGSITINDSQFNASLTDLASTLASSPLFPASLSERSGVIILSSQNSGITINSSSFSVDASENIAGNISIRALSNQGTGKITLSNSRLSASYGMGGGTVVLQATDGIDVTQSYLEASSNRYPLINGSPWSLVNGSREPLAFHGGTVTLNSLHQPISVANSQILSLKSTSGGSLSNSLLQDIIKFPVSGLYGGKAGMLPAYLVGYQYTQGGGVVELFSKAGISILENTTISTSSLVPTSNKLENTAGTIKLINRGKAPISISRSNLTSTVGNAVDESDQYYLPGGLVIGSTESPIHISESLLDVDYKHFLPPNREAPKTSTENAPPYPIIFLNAGTTLAERSELVFTKQSVDQIRATAPFLTAETPSIFLDRVFEASPLYAEISHRANIILGPIFDALNLYENFRDVQNIRDVEISKSYSASTTPPKTSSKNTEALNDSAAWKNSLLSNPLSNPNAIDFSGGKDGESAVLKAALERSYATTANSLGIYNFNPNNFDLAFIQARLAEAQSILTTAAPSPSLAAPAYKPAFIHLQRTNLASGTTQITAIVLAPKGKPISRRTEVATAELNGWIRSFQTSLSRRSEATATATTAGQRLSAVLIEPLLKDLREQGITALLLEVDRGLQAIPYGALPLANQPLGANQLLGDVFAITITPSLGMIELDAKPFRQRESSDELLLAGASVFANGLNPLPMVRQELEVLAKVQPSSILLDQLFTPQSLINRAQDSDVHKLHIATHVNFLPGKLGILYTQVGTISLEDLGIGLRQRDNNQPLDLISLSGCITALGDEESELGFVGMALQAGARSGIGTLWEVDDTATAAFFIQFYRYLQQGLAKDQALQATQRAFLRGDVRLEGERLVGPGPSSATGSVTLVSGIPREEQRLFTQGLNHPYYWAGMVLTGSPW